MKTSEFIRFMTVASIGYIVFMLAFVYPGSELYELSGISDDFWLTDGEVPYYTAEHPKEKLFEMKERLMDMVAIDRYKTLGGYAYQKEMRPYIAKYLVKFFGAV